MTTKLLSMFGAVALFLPAASRAETPPQACYGVTAVDAARPLHADSIESVSPIFQITRSGRHLYGAAITYRPGLGLDASQMQETLDCQIASGRHHESPDSPFTVTDVEARVRTKGDRLFVEITSRFADSAREILNRTMRLTAVSQR